LDASVITPILSPYAYSGNGNASSIFDGTQGPAIDSPDLIVPSLTSPGVINALQVIDNGDMTRTMSFSINAGIVNALLPLHDGGAPCGPVSPTVTYSASGCTTSLGWKRHTTGNRAS
jgi:hypothetical protein